jgi:DNA-binding XRE family transcriptional regulator
MKQEQTSDVGAKLKQYRVEHDLTFEEISKLVEVTPSTIYRIENGLVDPNDRTLYKLKKALPGFLTDAA